MNKAARYFAPIECYCCGDAVLTHSRAPPKSQIIARAHSDAEVEHLNSLGADTRIMGEREIVRAMIKYFSAQKAQKRDLA